MSGILSVPRQPDGGLTRQRRGRCAGHTYPIAWRKAPGPLRLCLVPGRNELPAGHQERARRQLGQPPRKPQPPPRASRIAKGKRPGCLATLPTTPPRKIHKSTRHGIATPGSVFTCRRQLKALISIVFHTHVNDHSLHVIALIMIIVSVLGLVIVVTDRKVMAQARVRRDDPPADACSAATTSPKPAPRSSL